MSQEPQYPNPGQGQGDPNAPQYSAGAQDPGSQPPQPPQGDYQQPQQGGYQGDQGQYQQGGYGQQQQGYGYPAGGSAPAPQGSGQPSAFGALFTPSFGQLQVQRFAGFFFVLVVIVAGLWWISSIINGIVVATSFRDFQAWSLLQPLLFGWIVPLLVIVLTRVGLDVVVASSKNAENSEG